MLSSIFTRIQSYVVLEGDQDNPMCFVIYHKCLIIFIYIHVNIWSSWNEHKYATPQLVNLSELCMLSCISCPYHSHKATNSAFDALKTYLPRLTTIHKLLLSDYIDIPNLQVLLVQLVCLTAHPIMNFQNMTAHICICSNAHTNTPTTN